MSLELGLEDLHDKAHDASVKFDIVAMLDAENDLHIAMEEYREAASNLKNLSTVVRTIYKHGSYAGFESLISDSKELSSVLGFDICNADAASVESMASSELLRGVLRNAFEKVVAAFDNVGDKIKYFIKTTLPFKEKYLKEMAEAKKKIAAKRFDEETFQEQTVSSALTKEKFQQLLGERKRIYNSILKACKDTSEMNVDEFIAASKTDAMRTWYDKRIAWRPILSWFKTAKVKELGFKSTDVVTVLNEVIAEIQGLAELNTWAYKAEAQCKKLESEISNLYAVGKDSEAKSKREIVARMGMYFFEIWEAASTYERLVRREMYFATYLARALLKSAK